MNSESEEYKTTSCCRTPADAQMNENKSQHSCCKLDSYNWLENIDEILGERKFDCVEIRFKNSRKDFFTVPKGLELKCGDIVAVEASPGHDIGWVSLTGETAKLQMYRKNKGIISEELKKVYRIARQGDIDKWNSVSAMEKDTMIKTRRFIGQLNLDMKINDVEYQGDGTKAIFYYTADERVDFRQLIKILADEFNIRIEMKQIGVRQESGKLGGIGPCGRELCCSSWITNFKSVSTVSARTQNLSLNPQKLAGQCGKLKCCLNFEQETYVEEAAKFPDTRIPLRTKIGDATFMKMDTLRGIMWYSFLNGGESFVELSRDAVNQIIQQNKKNIIPESLDAFTAVEVEGIKFDNVTGQDDLTRFDNVDKRKHKSKFRNKSKNFKGNRNQNNFKESGQRNNDNKNVNE